MTHPAFPPSGSATSFSEELAQALRRSGMTLEQVQDELRKAGTPVAAASLSYWQTGRSVPRRENSLRAVAQLERLFGMPTGHLAELLPPRPPSVPSARGRSTPRASCCWNAWRNWDCPWCAGAAWSSTTTCSSGPTARS